MFDDDSKWMRFKVPVHTPEWYAFRSTGTQYYEGGIGASEIAKFIGRNFYAPVSTEVFYQKIGLLSPQQVMNDAIYWGIQFESLIKDAWEFEDFDESRGFSYNSNQFHVTGDLSFKIRTQVDVPFYLVNKKYPWLFASLDGAIEPGNKMLSDVTGKFLIDDGDYVLTDRYCPLEIKAMRYYALRQWEGDMDPGYVAQVHQQMIVSESYYSEICVLEDGRELKVFPIYLNSGLADQILRVSHDLWYNKVLPGRKLVQTYTGLVMKGDNKGADMVMAEIQNLEPPVMAGEAYAEWLKRSIRDTGDRTKGTVAQYLLARKVKRFKKYKSLYEDLASEAQNKLLDEMRKSNINQLDFGKGQRVSFNKHTNRFTISGIKTPEIDLNKLQK